MFTEKLGSGSRRKARSLPNLDSILKRNRWEDYSALKISSEGGEIDKPESEVILSGLVVLLKKLGENVKAARAEMERNRKCMNMEIQTLKNRFRVLSDTEQTLLMLMNKVQTKSNEKEEELEDQIENLEKRVDDNEQESKRNNLIVKGIPKRNGEDTTELVQKIGGALGIDVKKEDIDFSYRLQGKWGGIVVRFLRRELRDLFFSKSSIPLKKANLGLGQKGRIVIREDFTRIKADLLKETRMLEISSNPDGIFESVWTRGGRIFAKVYDTSEILEISSLDDLPEAEDY